jgi:hypothetical protein
MQTHASKRFTRPQRIEKRTDTIGIERLSLGTEFALKEAGVDRYCAAFDRSPPECERISTTPAALVDPDI